jgi:hypothetical protein
VRLFIATWLVVSLLLTAASSQIQSKPLSNDDIIQMVSLGLGDGVIIEKIRATTTTTFDTSIDGLKTLKAANVSDAVLQAMINPRGSSARITEGNAANEANGIAENNLESTSEQGSGDTQDYQQALISSRKAAEQGQAVGQYNLGRMYAHGLGVTQDYQQALVWYQKAADQGYAEAELDLGWMYSLGLGVTEDHKQALVWYRKAADQGNANAQNLLKALHASGEPTDDEIIDYALRAASAIRNGLYDPTSFTLLQVVAFTKHEKDGRTTFHGCVHYVGSNLYGGRMQRWGSYSVDKKGRFSFSPGNEYSNCYVNKNDVRKDVTDEIQNALSGQ